MYKSNTNYTSFGLQKILRLTHPVSPRQDEFPRTAALKHKNMHAADYHQ